MQYLISFLEGIITFISPCLLPMLPIYISYFAGGVLGFTIVFISLGALAGTVGSFLKEYQTAVNIVSGLIVIVFGLNYLGIFKLNLFSRQQKKFWYRQFEFFLLRFIWYYFLHRLDTLRWCLSWFRPYDGFPTGKNLDRNVDVISLFPWSWNSFYFKCCPDSKIEDNLWFY